MAVTRRLRRSRPGSARRSAGPPNAYARILAVVRRIPRGRVATYGQIAALAGYPAAPRLAGYALHALPEGSPLPWHRVVAAGGRLSLARLSPDGAITQRLRLEREGVRFDARGRADLRSAQWSVGRPPSRSGAARRALPPVPARVRPGSA
ncbi:MAG TPA: MGMT family protein [Candidatus Acidoferrales bacterium]|nr:MGMT family protein [Candidatus Acidoferrales bacterium]